MKILKVIIAGGRDFNDYELLKTETREFINSLIKPGTHCSDVNIEIVSGVAKGADTLGERYALDEGYMVKSFPALWSLYGKAAGFIRNERMADYADACICFWDGESRGTKHMIDLSKQHEFVLRVINYIKPEPICPLRTYVPLPPSQ